VWRVRRSHRSIDVQLRDRESQPGVEIQYFYDGEPVYSRQWATRELALLEAHQKLRELQRAGWSTHW
jgi:hypothetical protein